MKYTLFFILLAGLFTWHAIASEWVILLCPALSCVLLATAYLFNIPFLVTGKRRNGHMNFLLVAINMPWLVVTYVIWLIQWLLSRENTVDCIRDGIYIGCYPVKNAGKSFDLVIDLTAEFPRSPWIQGTSYVCLPNLDGIALVHVSIPPEIKDGASVFIHCAQGHGRSATYCAILMTALGMTRNGSEALELIKKERPLARPSKRQRGQVLLAKQREAQETDLPT